MVHAGAGSGRAGVPRVVGREGVQGGGIPTREAGRHIQGGIYPPREARRLPSLLIPVIPGF